MIRRSRLPFTIGAVSLWAVSVAMSPPAWGQATTFEVGQSVEAREGDTWSAVSITAKEGRRFQIRYDDGTEEWVTADRLRAAGEAKSGPTTTTPATDAPPASKPAAAPAAPTKPPFRPNQKVEIKWGGSWRSGQIRQVRSDLVLISYERFEDPRHWEWITPDRVREPGAAVEGPSPFDQFTFRVGSEPVGTSYTKAHQAYLDHLKKQAQEGRDADGKRDPFAPPPFDKPVSEANVSAAHAVILPTEQTGWDLQPDMAPADAMRGVAVPLKSPPGDSPRLESFSISGNTALITHHNRSRGGAEYLYVHLIDLSTGKTTGPAEIDFGSMPLAVSPSGQFIAGRSNGFHGGSKYRLDLWQMQDGSPQHVISFAPFPEKRDAWHDITGATFIDEDHLLTTSEGGSVACWDVRNAKAIWHADFGGRPNWALSAGRTQLAINIGSRIYLIDARKGKALGVLPNDAGHMTELAFSPDGTRLVGVNSNTLMAWDLTQGTFLTSIGVPPSSNHGKLAMFDADHVLVGSTLFNVPKRAAVWHYDSAGMSNRNCAAGRLWATTSSGGSQRLCSWSLPHHSARQASDAAMPAESVLRQGKAVSIDLGGLATDDATRQAIRKRVETQLAQRNISVADGQPLRIVGRSEDGKTEQRTYSTFGGGPWNREQQTVNVTEKITRLYIESNGQVIWEIRSTSLPSIHVPRKEGQSIEQAVQESYQAQAGFLKSVYLPLVVLTPNDVAGHGSSQITATGITDR